MQTYQFYDFKYDEAISVSAPTVELALDTIAEYKSMTAKQVVDSYRLLTFTYLRAQRDDL